MNKGHDKGQMSDREVMKLALEALIWTTGSGDFGEGGIAREGAVKCLFPAIAALRQALERPQTPDDLLRQSEREGWRYAKECEAEVKRLRQALDHVPDTTKMIEPDMGIDRGAWDGVEDVTQWLEELRGNEKD